MECIHLNFLTDNKGKKFLSPSLPNSDLNGKILKVIISDGSTKRVYPVFQQKAGVYGEASEYILRHGCACCSLTTALAAFVEKYAKLTPDQTVYEIEKKHFPKEVYEKNYGKVMARQMPVSLYGISVILKKEGISCEYVGNFEDNYAKKQIMEHLQKGSPVIIETRAGSFYRFCNKRMGRRSTKIKKSRPFRTDILYVSAEKYRGYAFIF